MYSLLHEANAVRRVKDRFSDFLSGDGLSLEPSFLTAGYLIVIASASEPGKYLEKAILHACGVVTKL